MLTVEIHAGDGLVVVNVPLRMITRVRGDFLEIQFAEDPERLVKIPLNFTCPRCGAVSNNLHDVENRYCGRCHAFIDDVGHG